MHEASSPSSASSRKSGSTFSSFSAARRARRFRVTMEETGSSATRLVLGVQVPRVMALKSSLLTCRFPFAQNAGSCHVAALALSNCGVAAFRVEIWAATEIYAGGAEGTRRINLHESRASRASLSVLS